MLYAVDKIICQYSYILCMGIIAHICTMPCIGSRLRKAYRNATWRLYKQKSITTLVQKGLVHVDGISRGFSVGLQTVLVEWNFACLTEWSSCCKDNGPSPKEAMECNERDVTYGVRWGSHWKICQCLSCSIARRFPMLQNSLIIFT